MRKRRKLVKKNQIAQKKVAKTLDKGVSLVVYLHRRQFNYLIT